MAKKKNTNYKKEPEKLGYRTPSRLVVKKSQKSNYKPNIRQPFTARPRALGGHR